MRPRLLFVALLVACAGAARPAVAAFSTGCCACLSVPHAQTSQAPTEEAALACTLITGQGYPEFVGRCEDLGGNSAPCYEPTPGTSCRETLAAAGIGCPADPGAPVATFWGLGALAALLVGLGWHTARRHAG